MDFTTLDLPLSIKTTKIDPISAFFVPVLEHADHYDVAVGFFSTAWIRDAAEGIAQFACNSGEARWVISPSLALEDYEVLRDASGHIDMAKANNVVERSFEELLRALKQETRRVLAWLVHDGVMEFRIAVPKNKLTGMLHAKMGVFRDPKGNQIGFSGSYNFTSGAATNWESIEVYCSWRSQEAKVRILEMETYFIDIWNGDDDNLAVFKPSEKALTPFVRETKYSDRPYAFPRNAKQKIQIPAHFLQDGKLRSYQLDAIRAWFENDGKGVFSMATGSGKTVTALAAATRLANHAISESNSMLIVITVPYQHLADQWATEAKAFGFDPVICYGGTQRWLHLAQQRITELSAGITHIGVFIAVNDTFANSSFQGLLSQAYRNVLLIADEMHNLGAMTYRKALPEYVRFRLGLSATPVRHGDEQGTKALEAYFGRTVYKFKLREAIEHKFLCSYYYKPVLSPLCEEEMLEYIDLSARIAKIYSMEDKNGDGPSDALKKVLIERARLIARVRSKLTKLRELLADRTDSAYNLIYCGDSRDSDHRQVDRVLHLVGNELGMRASKFTAEESANQRIELLDQFKTAELQALIAIRCLDEGVDVPRTETAYILASSTNPRQYIQRRGRVLRCAPGKTTATIYDFVAVPNLDELGRTHAAALETERRLVRKELQRVNKFAELSLNPGEALGILRQLKNRLNLMDL